MIGLAELRTYSSMELKDMALFKQTRHSVTPVSREEWGHILALEQTDEPIPEPRGKKRKGGGSEE